MARTLNAWGLDVGNTSLKAIKLRREGDGVAVDAFDVVEHDKFLTEPDIDQNEIIRHTLSKFLERNPIKGEAVFIGVPGSKTFARFVKLPPVEPKKIPEIVKFEAIQQIPFPLEQVNWDYQTFTNPDSPEVEVGIFAMKKELVAQVMSNFAANDMIVGGVQMSPLAVYNAAVYDEMTQDKGTVILDIGAEHTDLIFIDSGRLWLRTINIGGNAFTDALSKSFKVSFAKAETLKKTAATSKYAKQIFQAMRPVFADLVAEIQRSIGFYNSSHRDSRLERIIGMGNPFKLPNLQKYIQQELKMEVVRLEGFKKAAIDGKLAPGLQEHVLAMSGAYGLALQGLDIAAIDTNLLPTEIARQMVWKAKRPWFYGAAAAIALGVGVTGLTYWSQSAAFASNSGTKENPSPKAAENNNVVTQANLKRGEFQKIADTYKQDKGEVESYLALTSERKIWPSILQDIFQSLPQAKDPKAAEPDPDHRREQKVLILKSVATQYYASLTGVTAGATPPPDASGGGDVMMAPPSDDDGGYGSGRGRDRGFGAVASPVSSAGGASAGPGSDRGFMITITGYTPLAKPYPVLDGFMKELVGRSPAPAKDAKGELKDPQPGKAYYFEIPAGTGTGYTIRKIVVTTTGTGLGRDTSVQSTSNIVPWGNGQHGPFWDTFVPPLLNQKVKPDVITNTPAMGGLLPGDVTDAASSVNITKAMDPDVPGKDMGGWQQFTAAIKVYLKAAPNP